MTKTCTSCGEEKPLDDFSLSLRGLHGRKSKCRSCQSVAYREWHSAKWKSDEEWKQKRTAKSEEWTRGNPEKRAVIAKRRNQKAKIAQPEKLSARALVNQRVRFGRMPRAADCQCSCGNPAAHYHHHKGYSFEHRYDVVPVCTQCHKTLG